MLKRLLILNVFLLIPCILTSQDGSIRYPLTEFQIRQAARLKIEYTFLLNENRSMYDMLRWCDSIHALDSVTVGFLNSQIILKDEQIHNRQLALVQWEAKYAIADNQRIKERKKRIFYMGTTAAALALLAVSIF